ncbi:hypothetical protein KAR48_03495 [bacterium]|nr:hypothetical protein [bacterium]
MRIKTIVIFCTLLGTTCLQGQSVRFSGQVDAWGGSRIEELALPVLGLRYVPEFYVEKASGSNLIDAQASFNLFTSHMNDGNQWSDDTDVKLYRTWLRYSNAQSELRLGLQKINFGSASLIRPLMWFDRIDPRDPLQLTDGVWGILYRRYFINNTNFWLWALWGNEKVKGWEAIPTHKTTPEFGGRMQFPVPRGELAATFHHRRADLDEGINAIREMLGIPPHAEITFAPLGQINENRFGLDGKWDFTIGFWVESAFTHRDITLLHTPWQRMTVIGADYTFGLGNGLHVMTEHARIEMSEAAFSKAAEGFDFTALSLNYPLGLLDTVSGLLYRDWDSGSWYRFIRWQRTYDAIQLHAMAFWNPDRFAMLPQMGSSPAMAGKGFQLLFVFNH